MLIIPKETEQERTRESRGEHVDHQPSTMSTEVSVSPCPIPNSPPSALPQNVVTRSVEDFSGTLIEKGFSGPVSKFLTVEAHVQSFFIVALRGGPVRLLPETFGGATWEVPSSGSAGAGSSNFAA